MLKAPMNLTLRHRFWGRVTRSRWSAPGVLAALVCVLSPMGSSLVEAQEGGQKLAPNVLTVVPANPQPEETSLGPIDLDLVKNHPELAWQAPDFPNNAPFYSSLSDTLLASSSGIILRHAVYALEFAFKPMRTIEVTFPGSDQKKLVWYLVYRVRYLGNDLYPNIKSSTGGIAVPDDPKRMISDSVLFAPRFTLLTSKQSKVYLEKVLPTAIGQIAARERVGSPLLDTVEMMRKIPKSTDERNQEFWGVATWTDIDPTTNFFVVHVEGLTNAYRIVVNGDEQKLEKKVLQIHFWRPGDTIEQAADVIRLGVPAFEQPERVQHALDQFGLKERLDYLWTYR